MLVFDFVFLIIDLGGRGVGILVVVNGKYLVYLCYDVIFDWYRDLSIVDVDNLI